MVMKWVQMIRAKGRNFKFMLFLALLIGNLQRQMHQPKIQWILQALSRMQRFIIIIRESFLLVGVKIQVFARREILTEQPVRV